MIWYEFAEDNGDGSFSKLRFKTKEEAEKALKWLENNTYFTSDGGGVDQIDTSSKWFFDSFDNIVKERGE